MFSSTYFIGFMCKKFAFESFSDFHGCLFIDGIIVTFVLPLLPKGVKSITTIMASCKEKREKDTSLSSVLGALIFRLHNESIEFITEFLHPLKVNFVKWRIFCSSNYGAFRLMNSSWASLVYRENK